MAVGRVCKIQYVTTSASLVSGTLPSDKLNKRIIAYLKEVHLIWCLWVVLEQPAILMAILLAEPLMQYLTHHFVHHFTASLHTHPRLPPEHALSFHLALQQLLSRDPHQAKPVKHRVRASALQAYQQGVLDLSTTRAVTASLLPGANEPPTSAMCLGPGLEGSSSVKGSPRLIALNRLALYLQDTLR